MAVDTELIETDAGGGLVARARSVRPPVLVAGLLVLLALPLLIALVALRDERWYPVLDLAMTELRVRDVGTSHTPMIGLPGRIGTLPDQGSHPGPWSFWLLAPVYRLLGQTAYALEIGTVLVHVVVIAVTLWCAHRVAGRTGLVLAALMLAIVTRGYGTLLLVQPWNPYFPLLAWVLLLWAMVAVLAGHHRWLIVAVAAGSFCAQTHIPYLVMAGGMCAVGYAVVVAVAVRGSPADRSAARRTLAWSTGVGVLLWLPPLLEQFFGDGEGNISRLIEHFGSPPMDPIGLSEAGSILLRHLDVWDAFVGLVHGDGQFVATALDGTTARWPGVLVLGAWLISVFVALRLRSRLLRSMHAVVALGLLLALLSTARIFGTPWYYLTLWMWSLTALLLIAVASTAVVALRTWRPPAGSVVRSAALAMAATVVVVSTAMFAVDALDAQHAEQHLSEELGPLVAPTYEAIVAGVGPASGLGDRFLLRWSDAHSFGSQAYGLLNELDRMGVQVGADDYFRVPVTEQRVLLPSMPTDPAELPPAHPMATAQLQFATGAYVDDWRAVPGAVEVATVDLRTEAELAAYEEYRRALVDELREEGLTDLLPMVERNVFGLSEQPELSPGAKYAAGQMLQIGTETAVFIAPLGAAAD